MFFVFFILISSLTSTHAAYQLEILSEGNGAYDIKILDNEVHFPKTETQSIFVLIDSNGKGKQDFDDFMEFPSELNEQGKPLKTKRHGLGLSAEVFALQKISPNSYLVKIKVEKSFFLSWQEQWIGSAKIKTPVFGGYKIEQTELPLNLNKWFTVPTPLVPSAPQSSIKLRLIEK
jgi:hypothetical protein